MNYYKNTIQYSLHNVTFFPNLKIVNENCGEKFFHALQKFATYNKFSRPSDYYIQNNCILYSVHRLQGRNSWKKKKLPHQRFINLIIGTIIITVFILLPDPSIPCGDSKNQTFYLRTQKPENWEHHVHILVFIPLTTRYLSMACTRAKGSILTGPPFHCLTLVQSGCLCSWHFSWWVLKNLRACEPLQTQKNNN